MNKKVYIKDFEDGYFFSINFESKWVAEYNTATSFPSKREARNFIKRKFIEYEDNFIENPFDGKNIEFITVYLCRS